MAATFARHWPAEIRLTVYAEGFEGDRNGQVKFVDLDQAAPWLRPWKRKRTHEQQGVTRDGYRFRWDAVRFAHKVAAIGAAAEGFGERVLIWLDADIVTHAPVIVDWLDSLMPADAGIGWLDRERTYPECGFLMFRLPEAARIIRQIVEVYRSESIFRLQQWHDSYVIEMVVQAAEAMGEIKVASLSGDARGMHHPFAAGPLGARMDHLKGSRKVVGRSRSCDLLAPRSEPYWQ